MKKSENSMLKEKRKKKSKTKTKTMLIKENIWNKWTDKSANVSFHSKTKGIGNGENKLSKEMEIQSLCGGQNSTIDLFHPILKGISVKDMTKDDCILGVEGSNNLNILLFNTVYFLLIWLEMNHEKNPKAKDIKCRLDLKYGKAKHTLYNSIFRKELSKTNLEKLTNLLEEIKFNYLDLKDNLISHIVNYMENRSFQDLLNEVVRQEAIKYSLFVVHQNKGYMYVKDIQKITCPRITRGSPRINICMD